MEGKASLLLKPDCEDGWDEFHYVLDPVLETFILSLHLGP